MTVKNEGRPVLTTRSGAEAWGMAIVEQKPRIADVRIREMSRASRSWDKSRDRNWTKGPIMNEFQRKESSKLSISKVLESMGLHKGSDAFRWEGRGGNARD